MTVINQAERLLQDIAQYNVKLTVYGDKLRYFPADIVDSNPGLKARLTEHKKAVISLLASGSTIIGSTIHPDPKKSEVGEGGGSTIQSGSTITRADLDIGGGWDPVTEGLITWFIEVGQHCLPTEPFQLTNWQRIADPALLKKSTLRFIAAGPEITRLWNGHFAADLRRLRELLGEPSGNGEKGHE